MRRLLDGEARGRRSADSNWNAAKSKPGHPSARKRSDAHLGVATLSKTVRFDDFNAKRSPTPARGVDAAPSCQFGTTATQRPPFHTKRKIFSLPLRTQSSPGGALSLGICTLAVYRQRTPRSFSCLEHP